MTEVVERTGPARTEGADDPKEPDAEAIVSLRGESPPVVRLSRKAIAIVGAAGLTLVAGALFYGLRSTSPDIGQEALNTDGIAVADGLASAPSDYSQVPRLGPPLPGDLGKPILDAQDRGAVAALPPIGAPPPAAGPPPVSERDTLRLRLAQERDAARESRLFLGGVATASSEVSTPDTDVSVPARPSEAPAAAQAAFLDRPTERRTASLERLANTPSTAVLQAGSVIPAALITGIRSDQPGLVTAQVTQNVYDSLTGRRLLIAQGARLIGEYESDTGFGQRRILLAWTRLILPDGRSIVLERQPAADPAGYAGLEDRVDYHWGGVFKAAQISTLLGIGGELDASGDDELVRALRRSGQDSVGRTGEQIVSRELGVRPTLTIRPGSPVRVLVTRDIVMEGAP